MSFVKDIDYSESYLGNGTYTSEPQGRTRTQEGRPGTQ